MKTNKALRNKEYVWSTHTFEFTNTGEVTETLNTRFNDPSVSEVVNVSIFRNGVDYNAMIVTRKLIDKKISEK